MKTLDARKFKFAPHMASKDPFAFLRRPDRPTAVGDVEFTHVNELDIQTNDIQTGSYTLRISQHAAVELNDGTYLFCIVYGSEFVDTYSSNNNIRMQYYSVVPL